MCALMGAKPITPRPDCAVGHDWSPVGLYVGRELWVPCRRKGCPASLRGQANVPSSFVVFPDGFETRIGDVDLDLEDDPLGGVVKTVCREANYEYRLPEIPLSPGDVVIDLGAHVGTISIYCAKRCPGLWILAVEPMVENFRRLENNLKTNRVSLVALPAAVTSDGRDVAIGGDLAQNSGGASIWSTTNARLYPSISAARVLTHGEGKNVKLLKIDIEGAEYEVLDALGPALSRVDWLCVELHVNERILRQHDPERTLAMCRQYIPEGHIRSHVCRIGD